MPEDSEERGIPYGGRGMSGRKNIAILAGFVLSVSLIAVSVTAILLAGHYGNAHMRMLGEILQEIVENQPEAERAILEALKEYKRESKEEYKQGYKYDSAIPPENNILVEYGYKQSDFLQPSERYGMAFAAVGFLAGGLLFFVTLILCRKRENARIKMLTDYLEKVNTGSGGVLFQFGEDEFSKLQDEIYKTVTELYQTRDAALKAKTNFSENLYNIAHQIKTPITSISLSLQMMQGNSPQMTRGNSLQMTQGHSLRMAQENALQMAHDDSSSGHLGQIRRQLSRLAHLEEALLLLSRIDAGILSLEKEDVDVFTVLVLAADNLQEILLKADVAVDIPESGEMVIRADLEWTMEAVMNVLKNCMEHTPPGGTVHCSYEQNPLYTQIRIWDTGAGFAKEDIPHLFERFYRGRKMKGDGIGIGLALSKALIEEQNGTITARNLTNAGACFEIRFYSH